MDSLQMDDGRKSPGMSSIPRGFLYCVFGRDGRRSILLEVGVCFSPYSYFLICVFFCIITKGSGKSFFFGL